MDFVQAIAKTMNDLQANPVWQREALIGQGIAPKDASAMAQETADKAESKQMVEMIRARLDAGQPITESELMAIGSVNPELARVVVAMQKQQAPNNQYMLDPNTGKVITINKDTGTASYTPFPGGGVSNPPPSSDSPLAKTSIPPEFADNPAAAQVYLETLARRGVESAEEKTKKAEGAARFEIALSEMDKNLDTLKESGNIVSTQSDPMENLGLSISNSGVGRFVGDALGTERATRFENIENMKPRLIAALAQATGQSSKSLDSNAELKLALDSLGSGSYESRKAAVDTIRRMFANPDLLNQPQAPSAGISGAEFSPSDIEAEMRRRGLMQ